MRMKDVVIGYLSQTTRSKLSDNRRKNGRTSKLDNSNRSSYLWCGGPLAQETYATQADGY